MNCIDSFFLSLLSLWHTHLSRRSELAHSLYRALSVVGKRVSEKERNGYRHASLPSSLKVSIKLSTTTLLGLMIMEWSRFQRRWVPIWIGVQTQTDPRLYALHPALRATDPLEFPRPIICHGWLSHGWNFTVCACRISDKMRGGPAARGRLRAVSIKARSAPFTPFAHSCALAGGCDWTAGARPQPGSVCKWTLLSLCSHIPSMVNVVTPRNSSYRTNIGLRLDW